MKEFILKYKWWILAAIVIIIIIIVGRRQGWFSKTPKTTEWKPAVATSTGGVSNWGSSGGKCSQNADFPLKRGSEGKQVGALQRYINYILKQKGEKTIAEDCDFGPATEEQVLAGVGQDYVSLGNYVAYNITAFE